MSPLSVKDASQRQQALDPRRSFIVQAPAGAGKTELLIQRYLVVLAAVQSPEEVLAITFTRKAAAEMRGRILQALARAGDPNPPEKAHEKTTWRLARQVRAQDQDQGWELEDNPSRLRIQTIDSLCARLTRQMPVLSNLGAAPRVREEAQVLYREAARQTLAELDNPEWSGTIGDLLEHLDGNVSRFEQLLMDMLARRDQWLRHVLAVGGSNQWREVLERGLKDLIVETLDRLGAIFARDLGGELLNLLSYAAKHLGPFEAKDLAPCMDWERLPEPGLEALPFWQGVSHFLLTKAGTWRKKVDKGLGFPAPSSLSPPRRQEAEAQKGRWLDLVDELKETPGALDSLQRVRRLPNPGYTQDQWSVLQDLLKVLRLATAQLLLVFQSTGEVDFLEIGMRARQALGDPESPTDLALSLDYAIEHILIDEFQDTSVTQFAILRRLVAGWEPGDGRTFFGVGDPMQSIYRFREAEVGIFIQAAREGLADLQLESLILSANFRSQSGVVDWVNKAFPYVLPQTPDPMLGAVPYSPFQAQRPLTEEAAVQVHAQPQFDPQTEAETIVRCIQWHLDRDPKGRIAVLGRAARHLLDVAQALRQAEIPFLALDIEPLAEKQVVQDLMSLTRALSRPGDRLAWLAVLRSPWCGLNSHDLCLLAEGFEGTIWQALQDKDLVSGLSSSGQTRLERLQDCLQPIYEQRQHRPFQRLLAAAWHSLGGPACLQDQEEREAAEVFFRLVHRVCAQGRIPEPEEIEESLSSLRCQPDPKAGQGVQLMTIHKAKGLEFETVIIPGLGRGFPPGQRPLLMWQERPRPNGGEDLLLAPLPPLGQEPDASYKFIQSMDKEKDRLEQGRVLYVAATRAREHLHLLGHVQARPGQPLRPRSDSLLALLWPVVQGEFEAKRGLSAQGKRLVDEPEADQWLRRLPQDWQRPEVPVVPPAVQIEPSKPLGPERPEFNWAGELMRSIGVVVHRWLMHITLEGLQDWDADRVVDQGQVFRVDLANEGVCAAELDSAVSKVQKALLQTLEDQQGAWLLSPQEKGRCEYPLTGILDGRVYSVVLDRTFVDESDRRWIVDYKTGWHQDQDQAEFLAAEVRRYRPQLEAYARLAALWETRPIRLGLYFPLIQAWREWAWT